MRECGHHVSDEWEAKLAALRSAVDAGVVELDAGLGVETTPEELVAEILDELGIEP